MLSHVGRQHEKLTLGVNCVSIWLLNRSQISLFKSNHPTSSQTQGLGHPTANITQSELGSTDTLFSEYSLAARDTPGGADGREEVRSPKSTTNIAALENVQLHQRVEVLAAKLREAEAKTILTKLAMHC